MDADRVDDRTTRPKPGPWETVLDGGDYLVQRRRWEAACDGVTVRAREELRLVTDGGPRARATGSTPEHAWMGLFMGAVSHLRDLGALPTLRALPDTEDGIYDGLGPLSKGAVTSREVTCLWGDASALQGEAP